MLAPAKGTEDSKLGRAMWHCQRACRALETRWKASAHKGGIDLNYKYHIIK